VSYLPSRRLVADPIDLNCTSWLCESATSAVCSAVSTHHCKWYADWLVTMDDSEAACTFERISILKARAGHIGMLLSGARSVIHLKR
jgi:hypothetical protein